MNFCVACGVGFGSIAAFDRHRIGTFDYSFAEGLRMDPLREDGRRCLTVDELETLTDQAGLLVFARNARGSWSLRRAVESGQRLYG